MKPSWRAGGAFFPQSLSIIQSGVPLLAIISPVRSRAGPPPRRISLCQFARRRRMGPWSMKPHVTVIITFGDTCCFSAALRRLTSALIPRLWLIHFIRLSFSVKRVFIALISITAFFGGGGVYCPFNCQALCRFNMRVYIVVRNPLSNNNKKDKTKKTHIL